MGAPAEAVGKKIIIFQKVEIWALGGVSKQVCPKPQRWPDGQLWPRRRLRLRLLQKRPARNKHNNKQQQQKSNHRVHAHEAPQGWTWVAGETGPARAPKAGWAGALFQEQQKRGGRCPPPRPGLLGREPDATQGRPVRPETVSTLLGRRGLAGEGARAWGPPGPAGPSCPSPGAAQSAKFKLRGLRGAGSAPGRAQARPGGPGHGRRRPPWRPARRQRRQQHNGASRAPRRAREEPLACDPRGSEWLLGPQPGVGSGLGFPGIGAGAPLFGRAGPRSS